MAGDSSRFPRSAARAERGFQAEAGGASAGPVGVAERRAALNAGAKRRRFRFALRPVDPGPPDARQRRIAGDLQPWVLRVVGLQAGPGGAPAPFFGRVDEPGPQRIPLDVAHHREQMFVALHGERFEAALIEVAGAAGAVVGVPPHGVRHAQPAEKLADLVGLGRTDDEMPMIGHHDQGEDRQRRVGPGLVEHAEKRGVVVGLFEQREPRHRAIEHVEHLTRRTNSLTTRHAASLIEDTAPEKRPDPFFCARHPVARPGIDRA